MSPRRCALTCLLAVLGCDGDGAARFEMGVAGLSLADVNELQLSVVTDRKTVDCAAVTEGCVKDQFPASRFVELTGPGGAAQKAVRFSPDGGVAVSMSPGRDFAFVIEALGAGSPPQLLGSSCTYVEAVSAGSNRVSANPIFLKSDAGALSSCDPRQ
ncbi:MAG: hypothetical protein IPJ65_23350 [Archangiaceae bacterium]|nr:hypothetical protein [Archangiaceae bacterium]